LQAYEFYVIMSNSLENLFWWELFFTCIPCENFYINEFHEQFTCGVFTCIEINSVDEQPVISCDDKIVAVWFVFVYLGLINVIGYTFHGKNCKMFTNLFTLYCSGLHLYITKLVQITTLAENPQLDYNELYI
jgi:hypothetical protein